MNRILVHASKELERIKKKRNKSGEEIIMVFLDFSRGDKRKDPVLLATIRVPRSIAKSLLKED